MGVRSDTQRSGEVIAASLPEPGHETVQQKQTYHYVSMPHEPQAEPKHYIVSHTPATHSQGNGTLRNIFDTVVATGRYNFAQARRTLPSSLDIECWRRYLRDYFDKRLAFGWPINFNRTAMLVPAHKNHPSAQRFQPDVDHYIDVELAHGALAGPFDGPPVVGMHVSPLMTRPKKDSHFRRVIMDLSWPHGAAVNDGIDENQYIDGTATITLPTADYMATDFFK